MRSKHDRNPLLIADRLRLRDRVLPRALARSAHYQQIPAAQVEGERFAATRRTHQKAPWRADRNGSYERPRQRSRDAIAVKSNAVPTITVVTEADVRERFAVARGQRALHAEHHRRDRAVLAQHGVQPRQPPPFSSYISRCSARKRVSLSKESNNAWWPRSQCGTSSSHASEANSIRCTWPKSGSKSGSPRPNRSSWADISKSVACAAAGARKP